MWAMPTSTEMGTKMRKENDQKKVYSNWEMKIEQYTVSLWGRGIDTCEAIREPRGWAAYVEVGLRWRAI